MRFGLDVAQQRIPWDELVRRVQLAEELGFDGVWGFDHFKPMYGDGPGETFEGMTTLAALTSVTGRIRPPIWIGGSGPKRTLPLVARYADMWHAWGSPKSLREANERVDRLATEAGRDPADIGRASSISLDDLDAAHKHAGKWHDAGYAYLVCGWPDAGADRVEAFARDVMGEFTS